MTESPDITVVVPLCNEAETVRPLFDRIRETIAGAGLGAFEVIFVDDGSDDASWRQIEALKRDHADEVRALGFRRNLGKAAALSAGFPEARGGIVITMDADLQDDPADIPKFVERLREGYDAVSGWKQLRQDPLAKTLPSRLFNWATRAASGVRLHDFNCGFKAYRAEATATLRLYGELHRYIPVLLQSAGFLVTELPVRHHRRVHGVSKYGWTRLLKGGLDLITVVVLTRYLKRPGHFFGGFGLLSGFAGFAVLAGLSVNKLVFGAPIGHRPLFFLGILLLLLGVQLVSTGLLGELINFNAQTARRANADVARRL